MIPPGAGVMFVSLLLDEGDRDADGKGEGGTFSSSSRSFLIFMIALTGGGPKCSTGELEHPSKRISALARVPV
jgi:hypothetical protein